MTKLVFLDIDDVLNSNESFKRACPSGKVSSFEERKAVGKASLDPVLAARVQRVCDETGAHIVIVSSWRAKMPVEEIVTAFLAVGLTAPVDGMVGGVKFSGDLRARGARDWLANHPGIDSFVVIDNDPFMWGKEWKPLTVAPEEGVGITDEEADKAIRILNGECT